jgi:SAM-dependent methyltransferase
MGFTDITAADISTRSLDLARRRCALHGIKAKFVEQNAEATTFPDNSFAHVQSIGVIHHSPNPAASLGEIHRILRPGGRAVVAVYFKNFPLRHWRAVQPLARLAAKVGFTPKGRGRDDMTKIASTANELVRLYDGRDNPVGLVYTKAEYLALLHRFRVVDIFTYAFPARSLPFPIPRSVFKTLEFLCPFLICAVLEK